MSKKKGGPPDRSKARQRTRSGSRVPSVREQGPVDSAAIVRAKGAAEFESVFFGEPDLIFGQKRQSPDPKTGLALFGPYDTDDLGRPSAIRLGVIGTGATIELARRWLERTRTRIQPVRLVKRDGVQQREAMDPTVYQPFPGVEEVFRVPVSIVDSMCQMLTPAELEGVRKEALFEPRVTRLVDLLVGKLQVIADKAARPDVVLVVLPTEIRESCTVASRHRTRGKRPRTVASRLAVDLAHDAQVGQENLFDIAGAHGLMLADEAAKAEVAIFHHGLKARAMNVGIPTQLIWQGTLEGTTPSEDEATRAWNLWTGIYYKAGGVPWRVTGLDPGACYVGLSFFRDRGNSNLRTSMAQAFSDRTEGIVLRGEPFHWDSTRSPHLSRDQARSLLSGLLDSYRQHVQHAPARVVLHKWQRFESEERAGFQEALHGAGVGSTDLVAFGNRDIRFFRLGTEPPIRGTTIYLAPGNALLYTRGYIPFLGTYPGMRVPRPIEITEHHGSAPIGDICREILALTKMDWNSAAFAGKAPITTDFAEDVGHILSELNPNTPPRPHYRFYM